MGVALTEDDLQELHFITHIKNAPSLLRLGILSHNEIERRNIPYVSIAMAKIQDRRKRKTVPGGKRLHEYANLYLNARNPMMYKRRNEHEEICVLRISKTVLREEGVVISDRNASSEYVRFDRAPDGLKLIDKHDVFARNWNHEDQIAHWRHSSIMCAEVLVPRCVSRRLIQGAYVSCDEGSKLLLEHCDSIGVTVEPDLFFR